MQCVSKNKLLFLADQGTLKFKSVATTTTATTAESSTATTERAKETMTVDYHVYKELPESMQQELSTNYTLVFQHTDKPSTEELPPWSQLDPTALLALPKEMQVQLLEAYGNKPAPPLPLQMDGLDYDVNIWNALPDGKIAKTNKQITLYSHVNL